MAGAQYGLAPADVSAGEGDEAAGRYGLADLYRLKALLFDQFGVFHQHHGIGATRHHTARGDHRGVTFGHRHRWCMSRGEHFVGELQQARCIFAGTDRILRAQREAVDIGTVESRHVHR